MSFETDLELLSTRCNNNHLLQRIRRKHDTQLLDYQLKKYHLFPTEQKHTVQEEPKPSPAVTKPTVEKVKRTTVTFATLEHYQHTRFEEMPTPQTQDLWLKNRDEYRLMQHCHLQLKTASSNDERATIRESLLKHHTEIRNRWALIDDEIKRLEQEKSDEAAPGTTLKIQTIRSYITKTLKKETISDKQRLELQHRVDALIAANEQIKPETADRLREKGIKI